MTPSKNCKKQIIRRGSLTPLLTILGILACLTVRTANAQDTLGGLLTLGQALPDSTNLPSFVTISMPSGFE